MPTLNWIGKDKVITHHLDVPYRVLDAKYGYSSDFPDSTEVNGSENMIIHGDNLEVLKALLPKYEGKVDCVYIDPPYNTGNEKWIYNDNVNDPKIRKWLGEVVGTEEEDLCRHDKWLCMMYPRLKLLQQLLAPNGVIFISCDENELYSLKLICDEIFGSRNFIGQWNWYKSATPPNLSYKVKRNLEYILCYEKERSSVKYRGIQKTSPSDDPMTKPQNTEKVLTFPAGTLSVKSSNGIVSAGTYGTAKFPNILLNDMIVKDGKNENEVSFKNRFIWVQAKLDLEIQQKTIFHCSKQLVLSYKRQEYDPEVPPNLIDSTVGVNTTEEAGKLLSRIFGGKVFDFPKDVGLIEYLLNFICDKNAIILDCFAGSGTTGHAVLNLNKGDGGNRHFVLCEMCDYAETLTAERIKRVARGYGEGVKAVEGTGGAFNFYELGEPVFNCDGNLNGDIGEDKIREYIYYSETRQPLKRERDAEDKYYLDSLFGVAYYFVYEPEQETVLSLDSLSLFKQKAGNYVIYADICTIPESYLSRHNIVFKQIPRDIKHF